MNVASFKEVNHFKFTEYLHFTDHQNNFNYKSLKY